MKFIETIELGSTSSTVEFKNIPQNFGNLIILFSARSAIAATDVPYGISFNSVSAQKFVNVSYNLVNTSLSAANGSNLIGIIPGSTAAANTFGFSKIEISSYSKIGPKAFNGVSAAVATNQRFMAGVCNKMEPVTQITFSQADGFVAGSQFWLYGIEAGSDGITTTTP